MGQANEHRADRGEPGREGGDRGEPGRDEPRTGTRRDRGGRLTLALVDAGIGLLAAAAAVRRLRPDADLVLSCDPDSMPWDSRSAPDLTARALALAAPTAAYRPDALIVACGTATLRALPALRARLEPPVPVLGALPAIAPAVAAGGPVAVWTGPATADSPQLLRLIRASGRGNPVTPVPCPGLSDAVERADEAAISSAVASAARRTPGGVRTVVLGCTHFELVAEHVRAALRRPGSPLLLHGSAGTVAARALRRIGEPPAPRAPARGTLTVLLNGREAPLPTAALAYGEGRLLRAASPALRAVRA